MICRVSLFLIFVATAAYGDANEGVLFGYKLGDQYAATEKTRRLLAGTIVADATHLPADLDNLLLVVTPKTYTIMSIRGVARFDNIEHATEMKGRYRKSLLAEYSDWGNTSPREVMPLHLIDSPYYLTVRIIPSRTIDSFELEVSLTYMLGTKEHADMETLRRAEVSELISQAK